MNIKNILFDVDGTLINSKKGIIKGIKYSLEKNQLRDVYEKVKDILELLIGGRIEVIFNSILSKANTKYDIKILIKDFRTYYDKKGVYEAELYEGIIEILEYNRKNNIMMFIVTNKPKHVTKIILEKFKIRDYFKEIVTFDIFDNKILTKVDMVLYLLNKYKLKINETCIVGDQKLDMEAGYKCNILPIFANYGYGKYEKNMIKINKPIELLNFIK